MIIYDDTELPIDEIWSTLTSTKTKPNLATVQRSATDPDSLYELEKGTQEVVSAIMSQVQSGGGTVKVPGVDLVSEI
jgi:Chromatin associated protein KTI12